MITDGEDNHSTVSLRRLIDRVKESDVLIYTVGMFDSIGALRRNGMQSQLEQLAEITGGYGHFPTDMEKCRQAMAAIAHDVSQHYTIGYYPSNRELLASWLGIPISTTHALTGGLVGAGIASTSECAVHGLSPITTARRVLDGAHYLSAGAVGFARGVNDTPKLVALLLPTQILAPAAGLLVVAVVMAVGGVLFAHRVAETMSHRVTPMNPGQGFAANVITAALVLGASRFGLPVSTTHVSNGSLFGLGAIMGTARWRIITQILLAWLVTLPCSALCAALLWWLLN